MKAAKIESKVRAAPARGGHLRVTPRRTAVRHTSPFAAAAIAALLAAPASAQIGVGEQGTYLIRGGTVVVMPGQSLPNASVLIRDGRIAEVGANVQAPAGAQVIDATGKFVYPGMIDAYTPLGLAEIGGIATMNLRSELGDYNPHDRAIVAVNVDSEMLGITRVNGVTNAITAPSGGVIPGQAALIHTAGWTWEDMAAVSTAAYVINYPRVGGGGRGGRGGGGRGGGGGGGNAAEQLEELKDWLRTSKRYDEARTAGSSEFDIRYEAMRPLVRGEAPALVSADNEEQIRGAIALQDTFGLRVVILGGGDAWRIADEVARAGVPIVLGSIQSTPSGDEPYDAVYAAPGVLRRAGVKIAFSTGGASDARHVPYHASLAVAYGLSKDDALRALTIWPAEMFGAAEELGSIERGKIANLFVTTGDPLDVRSQVSHVFIKGRNVPMDDRHTQFYMKYNTRPKGGGG